MCACVLLTFGSEQRQSCYENIWNGYAAVRICCVSVRTPVFCRRGIIYHCWKPLKCWRKGMWGKTKWVARKRSKSREASSSFDVSVSLTAPPQGSDVRVWVGRGFFLMRDPAADVTFLPVKATPRALHTIAYVTHQSSRKRAFPFFPIPLLFPIKSTKRNVTLLLPDGNFPSTFQWISEQRSQKKEWTLFQCRTQSSAT